ncbi:MAG: hypothetical protein H7274_18940, partial [Rhodoferax sp.]|nr:hypothetical protein [Rhodoferax sp.]
MTYSLIHRTKKFLHLLLGACLLVTMLPALAQFRVEVSGVGMTQLPIAVAA